MYSSEKTNTYNRIIILIVFFLFYNFSNAQNPNAIPLVKRDYHSVLSSYSPKYELPWTFITYDSEIGDTKMYYRRGVGILYSKLDGWRVQDYLVVLKSCVNLIEFCDGEYGFVDFEQNDMDSTCPRGYTTTGMDSYNSSCWFGMMKKMGMPKQIMTEFMMERQVAFLKDERFVKLPKVKKEEIINKSFKKNTDRFCSTVYMYHESDSVMAGKLYDYQLSLKNALLVSQIKMKQKCITTNDRAVKRLYKSWKSNPNDSTESILNFVAETGKSPGEYNNEGDGDLSSVYGNKRKSIDSIRYGWKDIQKVLKPEEASIEIVKFNKCNSKNEPQSDSIIYLAVILTQKALPKLIVLGNGNPLETKIDTMSYKNYWNPIDQYLKLNKISTAYVCPDGIYRSMNFGTLYDPKSSNYSGDIKIQPVINSKVILDKSLLVENK
ncbi:MAG TPA: hypothetical protein VNB90_17415 [Cytophagaceae bacterium]|jgi:hypothetical protein|nr:hypothetical protein [Cytophagaceae bacterium]